MLQEVYSAENLLWGGFLSHVYMTSSPLITLSAECIFLVGYTVYYTRQQFCPSEEPFLLDHNIHYASIAIPGHPKEQRLAIPLLDH